MEAARYKTISNGAASHDWLVLVHGFTQNSNLFSAQVETFSAIYNLLLVDLPGHGLSSNLPGPYGQVEYAAAVEAAIVEARIEKFHFWGTHTGAAVGLLLAAEGPSRFHSLVLEGAVIPGETMSCVTTAIERAKRTAAECSVRQAIAEWYREAGWFDVIRRHTVDCRAEEHLAILAEFEGRPWLDQLTPATQTRVRDRLSEVHVRTLLINGEHDLHEFRTAADLLEAELPNAIRLSIDAAGGFPQWERPQVVNERVLKFLQANK